MFKCLNYKIRKIVAAWKNMSIFATQFWENKLHQLLKNGELFNIGQKARDFRTIRKV